RSDWRRRSGGAFDGGEHVTLGDAAIPARAGNARGIDAGFGGELAHRRRERRIGRFRRRRRGAGCRLVSALDAAADGRGADTGGDALGVTLAAATGADFPVPAAPSLIRPRTAPTATVSPSLAAISASTPAAGAGTSIVTLSVSSSTRGSSTATGSPGFLNH